MDTNLANPRKYHWLVTENAADGGYYQIYNHPGIKSKRDEGIDVCKDFVESTVFPKLEIAHKALVKHANIYHLDANENNVFFAVTSYEAKFIDFGSVHNLAKKPLPRFIVSLACN